jgi:hypothetical protein
MDEKLKIYPNTLTFLPLFALTFHPFVATFSFLYEKKLEKK